MIHVDSPILVSYTVTLQVGRPGSVIPGPHPFLAPGTGLVEDSFSTDKDWGEETGGGAQAVLEAFLTCPRLPPAVRPSS